MKLINTVQAGKILNVPRTRISSFIKSGYLKDYAETAQGKKRHNACLNIDEVKEFHRNYNIQYRKITIRHQVSRNGHAVQSAPQATSVNLPIPVPPSFKPITRTPDSPVQSFNERLQRIEDSLVVMEDKLNTLLKIWI